MSSPRACVPQKQNLFLHSVCGTHVVWPPNCHMENATVSLSTVRIRHVSVDSLLFTDTATMQNWRSVAMRSPESSQHLLSKHIWGRQHPFPLPPSGSTVQLMPLLAQVLSTTKREGAIAASPLQHLQCPYFVQLWNLSPAVSTMIAFPQIILQI